MTANAWLIVICLAVLVLWVVAGIIDDRAARRPLARVAQPAPPVSPLPPKRGRPDLPWPSASPHPDLPQARDIRRSRARRRRTEGSR